jgi:hypothetical protein
MIKFEWDNTKEPTNIKKHGISFEEASSVFYDDFALQFYDDSHSELEEDRFLMLGMSNKAKMLMVCYCEKQRGNVLRIISARKATKNEQKFYRGK